MIYEKSHIYEDDLQQFNGFFRKFFLGSTIFDRRENLFCTVRKWFVCTWILLKKSFFDSSFVMQKSSSSSEEK